MMVNGNLGEWPDEREVLDDRLAETGALGGRRRISVVTVPPPFRCHGCTRGIQLEGLCERCTVDRDEEIERRRTWRWASFVGEEKD